MNITEAMDDPLLFAPFFRGGSWDAWRAFLAALFGLPMDDAAFATFRHHTGRVTAPETAFKEVALVIGRRGGKSRILATIAVYLASFRDYLPYLAPGEVATIGIIAADRRQARQIFRYIEGLFSSIPLLKGQVEEQTAEAIRLKNRVVIEIATASFRVTRGYSYAAVLADETAFWRSEDSANPDVEIFAALRPGLATIPGAMLLNASSPYRKRGVLYSTFSKHFGQDSARVLVWKGQTLEMNSSLDPQIVQDAYDDDPEAASAEFGGAFRADLSDFAPRDVINGCTPQGLFEIAPCSGVKYVAFIDPSGGTGSDSMTVAVAHKDGEKAILDAVREVRPPFSPEAVTADFSTFLKSYRVTRVTGDRYAGEWPRERFRERGIQYDLSESPKSEIYLNCLPLLNSGRAQLLNLPRLVSQFCGLERRTSRSGRDSIDHGPGQHDDVCNVAAGALLLADAKSTARPTRCVPLNIMGR